MKATITTIAIFYIFISNICFSAGEPFRTASSGNWNSVSTWQMSTNGGSTWIAATGTPNNSSGVITIRSPHIINVTANDSIDQVVVSSGAQLNLDTLTILTIKGVSGTGLSLNNGGTISGKGIIQMKDSVTLVISTTTGFKVKCEIKSGTTSCTANSGFNFNGKLSIYLGATLYIINNGGAYVMVYNDVINYGTITGNSLMSGFAINGPTLENYGLITNLTLLFNDTISISGNGSFASANVSVPLLVSLSTDVNFTSIGTFKILGGGKLNLNSKTLTFAAGTLVLNGGTIINSGTIQTQGTPRIEFTATSNFNAPLRIMSGTTTCKSGSYNGKITIDSGATLLLENGYPFFTANNEVINNGTIMGNAWQSFTVNGPTFVNNGSITTIQLYFYDTTSISGSGSFAGSHVEIYSGSQVYLPLDVNFSSIGQFVIDEGGLLNLNSSAFTISSGVLYVYGTISTGIIQTQGTPTIFAASNFNSQLRITSGTTTCIGSYNEKISIDSGATLLTENSYGMGANNDVINNGSIIGNGLGINGSSFVNNGSIITNGLLINSSSFVNNGSLSVSSLRFDDTTTMTGSGGIEAIELGIGIYGVFSLINDLHCSSVGVSGKLNLNSKTLTIDEILNATYGTISSGTIQTYGISTFYLYYSNISASLNVKSGITTFYEPGTYNGNITIDSGATLFVQLNDYSNIYSIIANGNVINNGVLSGNGTFIANGPSFVNNGTVTTNTLKLTAPGIPFINNGTLFSTNGTIEYNGISAQTLATTNVNYANLTINNPAGVNLDSSFSIPGLISVVNGDLDLNGKTITLIDTARISETPGNTIKGNGSVTTVRNINKPYLMDVGGLGAVITSNENLGLTTITRTHNTQNVAFGKSSIKKNFSISPANNTALNANFIFKYDDSELDTLNESSLALYRSTNGGANFTLEGGYVDTANNRITLNYVQSFSSWTAASDSNVIQYDSVLVGSLYAKGKFPIRWGSFDTIKAEIKKVQTINNDSIKVNFVVKNRETFDIITDSILTIPQFSDSSVFINFTLPYIINPGGYSVIVQAIPDELVPLNGYDIKTYNFDVTCDAFNYIEPLNTLDGGAGFNGQKGRMVAGFRNLNSTDVFPIYAIDHSFLDSGSGNVPYKIAIYADNGSGKPGAVLYTSPLLTSPAGSNSVQNVSHEVIPPVNIPPNTKFYVGYVQTSAANIKASFQDEIPVRRNTFFFSNSDTNNVWFDFADSSRNFRIDISPRTSRLQVNALLQGFYNTATNKMIADTVRIEIRSFDAPYNLIDEDKGILDSNGTGFFDFTKVKSDSDYYFVIRHRNHIETWSHGTPEKFDVCDKYYNFTDNINKALGDNMIYINGKYMILSGDVNQDGIVDASDLSNVENDASNAVSGYVNTDITGDDYVDASDLSLVDTSQGMYAITP